MFSIMVPISFFLAAFLCVAVLASIMIASAITISGRAGNKFNIETGYWVHVAVALAIVGIVTSFFV